MTFPLESLPAAVSARTGTWTSLDITWDVQPANPNYGKPVIIGRFESKTWIGDIHIWATGEAELATIRATDDRMVNKHYDLTDGTDLDMMLNELVALLIEDRIPSTAVVAQYPAPPV